MVTSTRRDVIPDPGSIRGVGFTSLGLALMTVTMWSGCLGIVETADSSRTLPYHSSVEELSSLPIRPMTPPSLRQVGRVEVGAITGYYPLPIGLFVSHAPFNESSGWASITASPGAEEALAGWFGRSLKTGDAGPVRRITGVITHLEWMMLGVHANAGRIVSTLSIVDEGGGVVFSGTRETAARVPFLDALLRVHVDEWLSDPAFVRALGGEVKP